MSYRHNPALDDAFGVSPATWGREPDKPILPPFRPPPRNPAEKTPVRVPEGYTVLENGRIVKVMLETASPGNAGNASQATQGTKTGGKPPETPKAIPGAVLTIPEPVVVATVPPPATVLEKPGEDLLYSCGVWWHRCQHCGPTEDVLVVSRGRNPRRVVRPVFDQPRSEPIRHVAGCPFAGKL